MYAYWFAAAAAAAAATDKSAPFAKAIISTARPNTSTIVGLLPMRPASQMPED